MPVCELNHHAFLDEWLSHKHKLDQIWILVCLIRFYEKTKCIQCMPLFASAAPHKCTIDNITASHHCGDFAIVLCCNLQLIAVWKLFLSVPSTAGQLPIWSQTYWENTAKWQEIPLWTTPSSSTEDAFKTRPWACYIRVQRLQQKVYISLGDKKRGASCDLNRICLRQNMTRTELHFIHVHVWFR